MGNVGGIILCAGLGSRLMPLTGVVPKPAIMFCGAPMAHYARRALERAGVCELGMNVHHLPERMIAGMDGGKWCDGTRQMCVSREGEEILGTGGGAARVAQAMPACERYVIYHGDVLCGVDCARAVAAHEASGARVTMVVLPRPQEVKEDVRKSLGMIGVADGEIVRIRDWWKKGAVRDLYGARCFCGIHIVERSVLEEIAGCGNVCLVTEVYRGMLERGERIHAYEPGEEVFFADVGTPAMYLEAQRRCLVQAEVGGIAGSFKPMREGICLRHGKAGRGPSYAFGVEVCEAGEIGENVCLNGVGVSEVRGSDEMVCAEGGIRLSGAWISGADV